MSDETRRPDGEDEPAAPAPSLPAHGRREFLIAGAAIAATTAIGCDDGTAAGTDASTPVGDAGMRDDASIGADGGPPDAGTIVPVDPPEATTESTAAFDLGVASGDVTASSAILWARYTGAMPLELVVWEMDGDTYSRTAHAAEATPVDGYVHVDVSGLTSGARHRYAFFEKDGDTRVSRSAIGRFRAALADDATGAIRFGAVACVSNMRDPRPLAHAGTRDDLDLFLWLGDTTYNDGAVTLDEYRAKWAENLVKDALRTTRAGASGLATWDDHEFENDLNPETADAAQLAAGFQSYFENMPVRPIAGSPNRIWKSMRWGRAAEFFVLDCRTERKPSTRGDGATEEYISRAQMDWLKSALVASTATFKIILNSVPITDFPGAFDFAPNDRWEGYPTQRREILQHIDDGAITGVLWIAGDFHLASGQRVATSGVGATQIEILAGPAAQNGNVLATTLGGPQFDFATRDNNYAVIELDPATSTATVRWIDGDGSVIETQEYMLG